MQSTVMTSSSSGSFCGQLTPVHWFEPKACQIRESPSTNWGRLGLIWCFNGSPLPSFHLVWSTDLFSDTVKLQNTCHFNMSILKGAVCNVAIALGLIAALNSQYLVASWQMRRTWSWYRPHQSAFKSDGLEMGSDTRWFCFLTGKKAAF